MNDKLMEYTLQFQKDFNLESDWPETIKTADVYNNGNGAMKTFINRMIEVHTYNSLIDSIMDKLEYPDLYSYENDFTIIDVLSTWDDYKQNQGVNHPDNPTFDYHGIVIDNPYLDETGRIPVEPIHYYSGDVYYKWLGQVQHWWSTAEDTPDRPLDCSMSATPQAKTTVNLDDDLPF